MSGFSLVRGRAMRATRLDGCGTPVPGPRSVVATKGFISVGLTTNLDTGEAITVTNAGGETCVDDTPNPKFKNYGVEIAFCGVDPELINLLTGQPLVLDGEGNPAGFRVNSKVDVNLIGFALEVWSNIPGAVCDTSGEVEYGYTLLPFVGGGQMGDVTYENAAVNFTLTGAITRDGSGWGVGPFDVVKDGAGVPGPLLEPIEDGDHKHLQKTSVPPPTAEGGGQALGVPATGATAGIPATLTPANSYPPADLADAATGFTATPTTAWTTGQYVTLLDGSEAHWSGTAWVAGRA